jgi:hypothetical protein
MRDLSCRITGKHRALSSVALVIAVTWTSASAQVNSWTNATSANWDQTTNWSLAVLPNSAQSVMITNAGFKAVAINPSTPINFPGSMTVGSLTIRGGVNTLLLNFFGTAVPLTVLNGLTVADSGRIVDFSSGLVVQGGAFGVTNAQIIQDGGLVRTTNVQMNLSNSQYHLTNGVFEGGTVWVGAPLLSSFNQYGGTVVITNLLLGPRSFGGSQGGAYALYGGNLQLPGGLTLLADNGTAVSYLQVGGTNQTTRVMIEPGLFGIAPSFKLNGGLLTDTNVDIFGDDFGSATLEQNGGTHIVSNLLQIAGGAGPGASPRPATYQLNGGTLVSRSILLDGTHGDAVFIQTNGSAHAEQIQASSGGPSTFFITRLTLSGGALTSSNLFMNDGGTILQSSGALVVSNALGVLGFRNPGFIIWSRYTFIDGTITASNITIDGDWIIGDSSGTNRISNPGTITLSHTIQISNAVEQLGRLILASNAAIDLAGSASRLSFANSSGETWNGGATLTVSNWNGSFSGGGAEQLKFGTNQSGLTPAQLNQIQFRIGNPSNLFLAKILNTGEVVPDQVVTTSLTFSSQGNNLVLTWPTGWTLQTATNVGGPYIDIPAATSPRTNDTTLDPQRFFRLRQ